MPVEIDSIVLGAVDESGPGVAVAVVRDRKVVHRRGYGLADLEWEIPIAPDSVLGIGSMSKPFTATAILLLERAGKLRIDDPLSAYLPDYPAHTAQVTLSHLLTHTSGIPNYVTQPDFWERVASVEHTPAALRRRFEQLPLDFMPGTRYRYSNSGYHLLGMVIEAVSGLTYEAFIREHIFGPLGMQHSCALSHAAIIPRRARGYEHDEHGYAHVRSWSWSLASAGGGLASTLDDLIRWDAALWAGNLLDTPALDRMWSPLRLRDGHVEGYGLGWGLSMYRGRRVVHHAGGVPGYSSFIGRFIDDSTTIILLSNLAGFDCSRLAGKIANDVLGLPAPERAFADIATEELARAVGTYREQLVEVDILLRDGALSVRGSHACDLIPGGDGQFYSAQDADVWLRFEDLDDSGRYQRVTVFTPFYWFLAYRSTDAV